MRLKMLLLGGLVLTVSSPAYAWDMSLSALSKGLKDGRYNQAEINILVNRCAADPGCNFVPIAPPNDDNPKFQQAVAKAKFDAAAKLAVTNQPLVSSRKKIDARKYEPRGRTPALVGSSKR